MNSPSQWNLWFNRRGKLKGVAIVYVCSDYGLEIHADSLSEADRIEWCKRLCDKLNSSALDGGTGR